MTSNRDERRPGLHKTTASGPAARPDPTKNDPDAHPDIEVLDACAGGDDVPAAVREHVLRCAPCTDVVAALRQVRDDLAGLASMTMPMDLAARIGAALAAEPARPGHLPSRVQPTGDQPAGDPATDDDAVPASTRPAIVHALHGHRPAGSRRNAERYRRQAARGPLVAAACLVVLAGILGVTFVALRPSGGGGAASSSAVTAAKAPGAADGLSNAQAGAATAPSAAVAVVAETRDQVSSGDLGRHAVDLLTGRIPAAAHLVLAMDAASRTSEAQVPHVPGSTPDASLTALLGPVLRMCYLSLAAQTGGEVLGLDLVGYDGEPAVVVVLSVPDTSTLRVIVIDTSCGTTPVSAAMRYSTTTAR